MNETSFLIVGTNFINKGAEAMLKTVRFKIVEKYPQSNVYVICHPQEKEIAARQGFIPLYVEKSALSVFVDKVSNKIKILFGKKPKPYADETPLGKVKAIKNLKTVIDASGFAYGDKRGFQQPLESQLILDYCKQIGSKYIFMPQAWGGFNDVEVARNCKKMIESADAYFTRDEVSRGYVAQLLQKEKNDIPLMPDIAFHFPIPKEDGMAILLNNGYISQDKRPLLGISPNMRVYERMKGNEANNEYVQSFIEIIERLKEKYHIVLLPNEIRPEGDKLKDDSYLCAVIYKSLPEQTGITLIKGYYSAEQIKSVIKQCDLLIASRFHSLIFALSLGIPCLAISWSHKYKELFRLFEMERFVVEDEAIKLSELFNLFEELELNKEIYKGLILKKVEKIKEVNIGVFDLI